MTQEEFSRASKRSPMKRAKLRGLKRNAAVVLGNVGTAQDVDVDVLTRALDDSELLVREHAAWALTRLSVRSPAGRRLADMSRRVVSVQIRALRDAPDAGLSAEGTPSSRLALVETLTAEAWALAGHAIPTCPRSALPVQLRPLREPPGAARVDARRADRR